MRPSVDVIVPFRGSSAALSDVFGRTSRLRLTLSDTVTIVDNTRDGVSPSNLGDSAARIIRAPEHQSSYHARNRGAEAGSAEWLVFIDADVDPPPDLLDRYLADRPGERTAVLVGAVRDGAGANGRDSLAGRYARLRRLIDQQNTLRMARPYAKTANCAIRREAFERVGGFADRIRSGGDADLCFRLADAGWELESRPDALADHHSRRALADLLGQRARHGSGAEWLEQRYPGFVGPRRRWRGIVKDVLVGGARSVHALAAGDPDGAVVQLVDPLSNAAFEVGRRIPNLPWREQGLGRFPARATCHPEAVRRDHRC